MLSQQATYFFQLSCDKQPAVVKNFKIDLPFVPGTAIPYYAKELGIELEEADYSIAILDSNNNFVGTLDAQCQANIFCDDNKYQFVLTAKHAQPPEKEASLSEGKSSLNLAANSLANGIPILKPMHENDNLLEERIVKLEVETMELCFYFSFNFMQRECALNTLSLYDITGIFVLNTQATGSAFPHSREFGIQLELRENGKMLMVFKTKADFEEFLEVISSFVWKGSLPSNLSNDSCEMNWRCYRGIIGEFAAECHGRLREKILAGLKTLLENKINNANSETMSDILLQAQFCVRYLISNLHSLKSGVLQIEARKEFARKVSDNPNLLSEIPKNDWRSSIERLKALSVEDILCVVISLINDNEEALMPHCLNFPIKLLFSGGISGEMEKRLVILLSLLPSCSLQFLYELAFLLYQLKLPSKCTTVQELAKAFKSFTEQLENLEVNLLKDPSRLVHSESIKDLSFSHFYEGLEYWNENNLSHDYNAFYFKIIQNVGPNLAIVLHYKDFIAQALFDGLRKENSFAIIPFSNLLCLLAKDLRDEFYHSYGLETFSVLVSVLKQINDPPTIESIFVCITYLFKYLTKEIANDFDRVFGILSSVLCFPTEKKSYIRRFVSEALGFLLKRVEQKNLCSIFQIMVNSEIGLVGYEENLQTLANVIFHAIKSIKGHLNSRCNDILSVFCGEISYLPGMIGALLFLMEELLRHFDASKEKLNDVFKQHFFPIIFQLPPGIDEQQFENFFSILQRIVRISKGFLLGVCVDFLHSVYVPIAATLSLTMQTTGFSFVLFLLKSMSFEEFLRFKMLKIVEQLVANRSIDFSLWAVYKVSSCEIIKNGLRSILDCIDINSIENIQQLALLKMLGLDEDKTSKLLPKFQPSMQLCERILFKSVGEIQITRESLLMPLVLVYCYENYEAVFDNEKAASTSQQEIISILVTNLSQPDNDNLRMYSLKLLERFYQTDLVEFPVITELIRCQIIPLSVQTYKNKIVCLRNLEIFLNSTAESTVPAVCKEIIASYLIGEVYQNLAYYTKEVFKVIHDVSEELGIQLYRTWFGHFSTLIACPNVQPTESDVACNLNEFGPWLSQWYNRNMLLLHATPTSNEYKLIQLLELLVFAPSILKDPKVIVDYFIENYTLIDVNYLLAILQYFAQCSDLNNDKLHECFLVLLCSSNDRIQQCVLSACFSLHNSICHFNNQEMELLSNLTDEKLFKEELMSISLAETRDLKMTLESRKNIIQYVIRILFGKMGRKFPSSGLTEARRRSVFSFFATLGKEELPLLLNLLFRPFIDHNEGGFIWNKQLGLGYPTEQPTTLLDQTNEEVEMDPTHDVHVPLVKQVVAVLIGMREFISQMSNYIRNNEELTNLSFDCLFYCLVTFRDNTQIRTLALKRFAELFAIDLSLLNTEKLSLFFNSCLAPKLQYPEEFCRDSLQTESSAILRLLINISTNPGYHFLFDSRLIVCLIHGIGQVSVPLKVKEILLQILNTISSHLSESYWQTIFESVSTFIQSFSVNQLKKNDAIFDQLFIFIEKLMSNQSLANRGNTEMTCRSIISFLCTLVSKYSSNMQPHQTVSLLKIVKSLLTGSSEMRNLVFTTLSDTIFVIDNLEVRTAVVSVFDIFLSEFSHSILSKTGEMLVNGNCDLTIFVEFVGNLTSWNALPLDESLLLLNNFMHFVGKNDDFAARSSSAEAIKGIVDRCKDAEHYAQWINFILQRIKDLLKRQLENIAMECYSIFQQVIVMSPVEGREFFLLNEQLFVIDDDSDCNYFSNIFHIQLHRRIKAVADLRNFIAERGIPLDLFCDFFLPVLHCFCYAGSYDPNLVSETVDTIAVAFTQSPEAFHKIVGYLRKIKKDKYKKSAMRIICNMCERMQVDTGSEEFIQYLDDFVFPVLQENLFRKAINAKGEKTSLNSPLIVAMTSLLQKCRESNLNQRIPRIVFVIGNVLKSKSQTVRKEARECLVKVFQILGPSYANFLFHELASILNRGGYHAHVLAYTIRTLVNSIDSLSIGSVKTLLDLLFPLALARDERQEYSSSNKMAEYNVNNIPLIFERVAQIASDVECFEAIRGFFQANVDKLENSKHRTGLLKIVEHCSIGLGKNTNLSTQALLSISFILLNSGDSHELFTSLSLGNLNQILKGQHAIEDDNLLHPFLAILPGIVPKLSHLSLIQLGLNCITLLYERLEAKSAWIEAMANEKTVVFLLDYIAGVNPNTPESQKAFQLAIKTVCLLLTNGSSMAFLPEKLKGLALILASNGILRYEREVKSILSFFSAIIASGIVFSEFFDIVEIQVFPLIINHHMEAIRNDARDLFLSYLTKYPITASRFQNILCEKIVRNLDYEYDDGKISCLQLLRSLLDVISLETYAESVEYMFMNFVMCMGNYTTNTLHVLLGECVFKLVEHASSVQKHRLSLQSLALKFLGHSGDQNDARHLVILSSILRALSFAPPSFIQTIEPSKINEAMEKTFAPFPSESIGVLYRLLLNGFPVNSDFLNSIVLINFLECENISSAPVAIAYQMKIFVHLFKSTLQSSVGAILELSFRYLVDSTSMVCYDELLTLLIEIFKFQYSAGNSACLEIGEQPLEKFRAGRLEAQLSSALLSFCIKFYAAIVTILDWQVQSEQLNDALLLFAFKFVYFVEWYKQRLRIDDAQFALLGELKSLVRQSCTTEKFNRLYQQTEGEAEERRLEHRAKRRKEALEE